MSVKIEKKMRSLFYFFISLSLFSLLFGCAKKRPKIYEKKIDFLCSECEIKEGEGGDKAEKGYVEERTERSQEMQNYQKNPVIFEYEALKDSLNVRTYEEMFDKAFVFYSQGNIEIAARIFEVLANNSPNEEYREISLFNLAMSLERLGKDDEAEKIYSELLKSSNYEIRSDSLLRLSRIKISRGENFEIDINSFLDEKRKLFAYALSLFQKTENIINSLIKREIDLVNLENHQQIEVQNLSSVKADVKKIEKEVKSINQIKISDEAKTIVSISEANLNFIFAILEKNYPIDAVKRKVKHILEAQKKYMDVVRNGEPWWITAAVFKLGETYRYLFEDLAISPPPPELKDEEEIKIYRQELLKELEKALKYASQIYEKNINFAERVKLKTVWIKRSSAELEKVKSYIEKIKEITESSQTQ
jgi:tetratricopeptide (TPR) repeat protein